MRLTRTVYTFILVSLLCTGPALAQLSGSYDVGGGLNHYASFVPAIADLYSSGVSGPVTFNVYGGDYDEWANFVGPIPGASAANTVTFFDASGTARINITDHLGISEGALNLDSCSYLVWDGIDIYLNHVGDSTYKCIALKNNSSNNVFRNADMRGAGFTASSIKYGVYMWSRSCNDNLFDNLHFHRHNTAFYMTGSSTQQHTGNVIENCLIDDVWNGMYVNYVHDLHIRNNDIQINGAAAAGAMAVEFSTLAGTAVVNIYGNRFHNIVSSGTVSFIDAATGPGSVTNIYNNFFYDVQTSGTGSLYGIYGNSSGTINFYFNSMRIGDLAGTGSVYGYYKSTSSHVANIQNNIFYFAETVEETDAYRGLSAGYYPGVLDNNAYYNDGGAAFNVFDVSAEEYTTLADLQAGTAFEDNGVEGNPGFISPTDLHISNTNGLVSNHGAAIPGITNDIDGQTRLATPDIGADEYTYLAPANDYAVTGLLNVPALMPELTPTVTSARVQNRGSAAQTNVPVRLFYNGVQYGQVLVSLAPNGVDTVSINWTTPVAGPQGTLEVQSFLPGDANPGDDSATVAVQIVGLPMHGTYDIGGGGFNYASFGDAVTDMTLRSIDGAVTFVAFGSTYTETILIPAIPGASAVNTITFTEAPGNSIQITWASSAGTVRFDGADYVTFNGIDIAATGSNAQAVRIFGDADNNAFLNANISGAAVTGTSNYAVYMSGGGNDNNLFQNLTLSSAYYGIRLSGASGSFDIGNEVTGCSIVEGKYGVYLEYQTGGRIHHNDIQAGWAAAATEIYGVYAGAQGAADTVFVYNNEIHNLRVASGSVAANGIYTSSTNSRIRAYNNFIYDFQVAGTGPVYALRAANGTAEFYYNSVLVSDVATTGGTIGINGFFGAGTATVTLRNNIFQMNEASSAAYAINRSAAGVVLTSNNNCVYNGVGNAAYAMGRDVGVNYATLALWQGATGQDANSVEGDPGYVSASNLHIQPTFMLVNGIAVPVNGITTDFDGNTRAPSPDAGADEYTPVAIAHDYGVMGFVGLPAVFNAGAPTAVNVDVQNFGSSNETNVPVRLYFNNTLQASLNVTLAAGQRDTITFNWNVPVFEFQPGTLEAQAFLTGDGYADNDSTTASIHVVGGPMSGVYHLGGGSMHFATFNDAITSLNLRGIDGPVTIECWGGTYNESLVLTPITGASFTDRVTFLKHLNDQVTIASSTSPIVNFDGADYITFDGINLLATELVGYQIRNDADFITLRNLSVVGDDSTTSSLNSAVSIWRNGNDNVTLDNLTISGWAYGTRMNDGTGSCDNFEVMNCTITGANYGVYVDDVLNGRIHDNNIQPHGAAGTSIRVTGVYISSLPAGANLQVYDNRISNIRYDGTSGSPDVTGVWSTAGTGAGVVVYIYNNFIYGFSAPTGAVDIYGVYVSSGAHHIYNNSVHIPDGSLAARLGGVFLSTSSSNATLRNNIFSVLEADAPSYGIYSNSTTATLSSDNNCFYGTGTGFNVGGITSTNYPTLVDWQGLGHDPSSVAGNPGFMSATDLHIDPTFTLCDGAAVPLQLVTHDIDGDPRHATTPDIGADEYGAELAPEAIDDLTVLRVGVTNDVILRWSATANANSYLIYAGTTPDFALEPVNLIGTTAATSFTHTGTVPAAAKLFYVVVASTAPAAPAE